MSALPMGTEGLKAVLAAAFHPVGAGIFHPVWPGCLGGTGQAATSCGSAVWL